MPARQQLQPQRHWLLLLLLLLLLVVIAVPPVAAFTRSGPLQPVSPRTTVAMSAAAPTVVDCKGALVAGAGPAGGLDRIGSDWIGLDWMLLFFTQCVDRVGKEAYRILNHTHTPKYKKASAAPWRWRAAG